MSFDYFTKIDESNVYLRVIDIWSIVKILFQALKRYKYYIRELNLLKDKLNLGLLFPQSLGEFIYLFFKLKIVSRVLRFLNPSGSMSFFVYGDSDKRMYFDLASRYGIVNLVGISSRPYLDDFIFETMLGTEWRASTDPRHIVSNYFFEISEEY